MAKPMDVTLYNIHGFCHGTMGKPITWQNPYIMSFAMVYGFCHRSMAKPMGYPIPAWTRGARATFKAVLMAVDKTYALQTKCKTCLGGPRMILEAH